MCMYVPILMYSGEWPSALDDLTAMLGSNPTTALCLLDILEVAPEECGTIHYIITIFTAEHAMNHYYIIYDICMVILVR